MGVINFSYEITAPEIAPIFAKIFNSYDFVAIRDPLSRDILIESGVSPDIISVIPDLVFMTEPDTSPEVDKIANDLQFNDKTVVIVINGKTGLSSVDDWKKLVDYLRGLGLEPVLMSNELSSDLWFIQQLADLTGARLIEQQYSYRTYAGLMSKVRFVVSNRLHTCVLALVAGTPVVAVEPILRKVKGVFSELNYPLPVPSVREEGWVEQTESIISDLLTNEAEIKGQIAHLVSSCRERIVSGYSSLFHLDRPHL